MLMIKLDHVPQSHDVVREWDFSGRRPDGSADNQQDANQDVLEHFHWRIVVLADWADKAA
jgi:hypothetical protein